MSEAYRIHPGTGLVLFQGGGLVRYADWETAVHEAVLPTRATGIRRILSDRRTMDESYPAGMEDRVMTFFRGHARELGDVMWAVVHSNQVTARQTIELAARVSRGTRVRLESFSDLEAALRWLLGVYEDDDISELKAWIGTDAVGG